MPNTPEERSQFRQLLAGLTQEWNDAQSFTQWDPPDGEYMFRITDVERGIHEDGYGWWRVSGVIENADDPELNGKEWSPFYFSTKWFGFLKDFFSQLIGRIPANQNEADDLMDTLIGWLVLVSVRRTVRKNREVTDKTPMRVLEQAA